jgi:dihydroxyacid dehydratase/phosphogluconate dehydratase
LRRPVAADWARINAAVPRLVDVLPNGPTHFATVQVFLAGGVPEVMLHLRELGLLKLEARTVTGQTLGENLQWWEQSERRARLRAKLLELDRIDPDRVILSPARAKAAGLTSTITFLRGNLAPEGALVKSTAIDRELVDANGVYRHEGPARVFGSEDAAIAAVKSTSADAIKPGETIVLAGIGPAIGIPETYQITSALKYHPHGRSIALVTDGRFSGVSTGACIGHVSPEAWAGGPLGKVHDGDVIRITIDTRKLEGTVEVVSVDAATLAARPASGKLQLHPDLPDDTRLWAALQNASGGSWGGCVYDTDRICALLAGNPRS